MVFSFCRILQHRKERKIMPYIASLGTAWLQSAEGRTGALGAVITVINIGWSDPVQYVKNLNQIQLLIVNRQVRGVNDAFSFRAIY